MADNKQLICEAKVQKARISKLQWENTERESEFEAQQLKNQQLTSENLKLTEKVQFMMNKQDFNGMQKRFLCGNIILISKFDIVLCSLLFLKQLFFIFQLYVLVC